MSAGCRLSGAINFAHSLTTALDVGFTVSSRRKCSGTSGAGAPSQLHLLPLSSMTPLLRLSYGVHTTQGSGTIFVRIKFKLYVKAGDIRVLQLVRNDSSDAGCALSRWKIISHSSAGKLNMKASMPRCSYGCSGDIYTPRMH